MGRQVQSDDDRRHGPDAQDVRWELYPYVASEPHARAFILRLRQFPRRPKTVDAYARDLDRFLRSFADSSPSRWVEADEGDLLTYFDELRQGTRYGQGTRPSSSIGTLPQTHRTAVEKAEKVRYLSGAHAGCC